MNHKTSHALWFRVLGNEKYYLDRINVAEMRILRWMRITRKYGVRNKLFEQRGRPIADK